MMPDFGLPYLMDRETPESCAALCAELGLSFVELNIGFPACIPEHLRAERLLSMQEKYGCYFTLHMDEMADPFTFNPSVRQAWLTVFRQTIELALTAGVPLINMHLPRGIYITLPQGRVFMYERYRVGFQENLQAFLTLCDALIGTAPLRIAVENTDGWLPWEQQIVESLLANRHFGLTMDIGHMHVTADRDLPFFSAHSDHLLHMHAHDAQGTQCHLPFGSGELDLRSRLSLAAQRQARILLEVKTTEALRATVSSLPSYF